MSSSTIPTKMEDSVGEKKNLAARILLLSKQWEQVSKTTIAENVEKLLYAKYPECASYKAKIEKLHEISGSQKNTVHAWLNRSRENVKVPFLKLCRIAKTLEVDVQDLLKEK